jgi:cytoskeletal protein RodZ
MHTLKAKRGSTKNQLNINTESALHTTEAQADSHTPAMALANTSSNAKLARLSSPSKYQSKAQAHSQMTAAGQRASNLGVDKREANKREVKGTVKG